MFSVTAGADRRVRYTAYNQFAVYTLPIVLFYILMAFPTGLGNIEMVYGGFRETGGENLVGSTFGGVAIVTGRREINTPQRRLPVNAVFEHLHGMFH